MVYSPGGTLRYMVGDNDMHVSVKTENSKWQAWKQRQQDMTYIEHRNGQGANRTVSLTPSQSILPILAQELSDENLQRLLDVARLYEKYLL